MLSQTIQINLAAGESIDVCPIGSGTIPCTVCFFTADGCRYGLNDGEICVTCNDEGETVFRLTAVEAMTGWLHIGESIALSPDCPVFTAAKAK